jgi:O-antigen/teichoic acid export membrane protein
MSELATEAPAALPRGLRSLAGDSLVYGASIAALPVALIAATPVVTRELGTKGFGVVDVLSGLVALAAVVAGLGLDNAVARSWFDVADPARRLNVVRTGLAAITASSLVVAAVAFALFAAATGAHVLAAALAFAGLPLLNAQAIARLAFLLPRRRFLYLAAALVQALLGVGIAVALVLGGAGGPGYFGGIAAGAGAALAFTFVRARLAGGRGWWDPDELRRMLRFGLPLVPAAAAGWAIFAVDRTLVAGLRSFHDAGLYGIGAKVTAPLMLLASAFGVAWPPFIFGQPPERRAELRARTMTAVVGASAALLVWLVLFAPELVRLYAGDDFARGSRAVPGVALGWLMWGASLVLSTQFAVERRTVPIAVVTVGAAVANIVLNLALIPPFGFVGAAWVTAASFTLLAAAYAVWTRRLGPTPYRFGRLALVAVLAGAACAALGVDSLALRAVVAVIASAGLLGVAASDRERA